VRTGVEEFILNKATVKDFFSAIRSVGEKAEPYAHQLTRAVLSRIVRDAIRKREREESS
jgi:hypothetical protein